MFALLLVSAARARQP